MIGTSLTTCIAQICRGKVSLDEVEKIVAGTKAITENDWEEVISQAKKVSWNRFPEEGEAVCNWLRSQDKIEQSRVTEGWAPNPAHGLWVESEDQITRNYR